MPLNQHFNFLNLAAPPLLNITSFLKAQGWSWSRRTLERNRSKWRILVGDQVTVTSMFLTPGGMLDAPSASCSNLRKTCYHLRAKLCALNRRQ